MVVKLEIDISKEMERDLREIAEVEFAGDMNEAVITILERWIENRGNVEQ